MKYCKDCDKEFEDENEFCDSCGKKLIKKEPERIIEKKEGKAFHLSKMKFKIIAVISLIVLSIMLVYLINPQIITGMFVAKTPEITSETKALETGSNIAESLRNISANLGKIEEILD